MDFTGFAAYEFCRAMEAEREVSVVRSQWLRLLRDLRRRDLEQAEQKRRSPKRPNGPLTSAHSPWI